MQQQDKNAHTQPPQSINPQGPRPETDAGDEESIETVPLYKKCQGCYPVVSRIFGNRNFRLDVLYPAP